MTLQVEIVEEALLGYDEPVFSFDCPMCRETQNRDLSQEFVRTVAITHVMMEHNVKLGYLQVNLVELPAQRAGYIKGAAFSATNRGGFDV